MNHIARFGNNIEYRTKARIPHNLRGKLPSVLGRKNPPSLGALSKVLGIGGVPRAKKAPAATTEKEQG